MDTLELPAAVLHDTPSPRRLEYARGDGARKEVLGHSADVAVGGLARAFAEMVRHQDHEKA